MLASPPPLNPFTQVSEDFVTKIEELIKETLPEVENVETRKVISTHFDASKQWFASHK